MRRRQVRFCFKLALILCCILWPTSADVGDFQPIVKYSLPADIMRVEFADETWIYRLYEDGTVKKVTSKGRYAATRSGRESEPFDLFDLIRSRFLVGREQEKRGCESREKELQDMVVRIYCMDRRPARSCPSAIGFASGECRAGFENLRNLYIFS